jgi:hypothetical protein
MPVVAAVREVDAEAVTEAADVLASETAELAPAEAATDAAEVVREAAEVVAKDAADVPAYVAEVAARETAEVAATVAEATAEEAVTVVDELTPRGSVPTGGHVSGQRRGHVSGHVGHTSVGGGGEGAGDVGAGVGGHVGGAGQGVGGGGGGGGGHVRSPGHLGHFGQTPLPPPRQFVRLSGTLVALGASKNARQAVERSSTSASLIPRGVYTASQKPYSTPTRGRVYPVRPTCHLLRYL